MYINICSLFCPVLLTSPDLISPAKMHRQFNLLFRNERMLCYQTVMALLLRDPITGGPGHLMSSSIPTQDALLLLLNDTLAYWKFVMSLQPGDPHTKTLNLSSLQTKILMAKKTQKEKGLQTKNSMVKKKEKEKRLWNFPIVIIFRFLVTVVYFIFVFFIFLFTIFFLITKQLFIWSPSTKTESKTHRNKNK